MIIAQLSDPHVFEPGRSMEGRVDTAACLSAALRGLAAHGDRLGAVVLSGDLVNDGRDEQYAHLADLIAPALEDLACPIVPLMGNHDDRQGFRSVFGSITPQIGVSADAAVNYTIDSLVSSGGPRLVVLDTTVPGHHDGQLTPSDLAWLEHTLNEDRAVRTVVIQHHPAFASGVGFMDVYGLDGAQEEVEILSRSPHVEAVWSGHLHRHCTTVVGGVVAVGAPSTAAQVWLDLGSGGTAYSSEPGAYLLHVVGSEAIMTHVVSGGAGDRWVPAWAAER